MNKFSSFFLVSPSHYYRTYIFMTYLDVLNLTALFERSVIWHFFISPLPKFELFEWSIVDFTYHFTGTFIISSVERGVR